MEYLDCIPISNEIFVFSFPNEIWIGSCELLNGSVIVNKLNGLTINCMYLKSWYLVFESYLTSNEFVSTSIAYTNCETVVKISKIDFNLKISSNAFSQEFTFSKTMVLDIINSVSHMFVPSVCLNPTCTLVLTAIMGYFESQPDCHATLDQILQLSPANFLELIKKVLKLYNLSQNAYTICSSLIRHKSKIQYLYKLRCFSKFLDK